MSQSMTRMPMSEGISREEIEAARSSAGGWSRDQLAAWGVPWPPPKGWKRALIEGRLIYNPVVNQNPSEPKEFGVAEIDGAWFVIDSGHKPVSAAFATQAEAWRCFDREFDGDEHLDDIDRHNRIRDAFARPS